MAGLDRKPWKPRLPEYEMTPEIQAAVDEALDAHYDLALRSAFTFCADPRADIVDIVESSFAQLVAGWMLWENDPRGNLLNLVKRHSVHSLRRLPPWSPDYWFTTNYVRLFRGVASHEELTSLKAIMKLDDEQRRVYEARRVFGWSVRHTVARTGVNKNSVGPMTTRIEQKIDRTEGASALAVRAFFDRYMEKGGY